MISNNSSKIGAPLPLYGLQGLAVKADAFNGCNIMVPPPKDINAHWIAVISENNCTMVNKIQNAQDAQNWDQLRYLQ